MNFFTPILGYARTRPDAPALIEGDRVVTFAELTHLVTRLAGRLAALGVARGDRVGISLRDSWQHLVALIAVGQLGGVIAQIDHRAKAHEKTRFAEALGLKIALVEADEPLAGGCPQLTIAEAWQDGALVRVYEPLEDWDAPLLISMTSGTTGEPKFAYASHLQYYFRVTILPELPRRAVQGRYLSTLPLCFSAGRGIALMHLFRGDCIVLYPALFAPHEFVETVAKHEITAGMVSPSAARQLLPLAPPAGLLLPTLDSLICGGGPLFADEKRAVVKHITPNLFEFYGATAVGTIAILRPAYVLQRPDSVGQPNALIEVQIVDEAGAPLPPSATGRLRCRGPGFGDMTRTDLSVEQLMDGWYYPGEVGSLDEDGFLYLQGRESEVVIRGGAKIHPSEVEAVLLAHPGVAEAAVVGVRLPDNEEAVVAFVTANVPLEAGALLAHCRARLTAYKIPREIRLVTSLPRNAAGKVNKLELARKFGAPL
jgi:long-chain acyl-CoA synthetase